MCLPSDALLQHLPSYLGFSYLGLGVSFHGCSSKAQPLLLTLDEGSLLTAAVPDFQRGLAPLGSPVPVQPLLLRGGIVPPGHRPWPQAWVAPPSCLPWNSVSSSVKWGEMIPFLAGLCPEVREERNTCWHGSSGRSPPSRGTLAGQDMSTDSLTLCQERSSGHPSCKP